MEETYSKVLRRIAQNDYMIDTKFLPDGELLNEIADYLDAIEDWGKELKFYSE